MLMAPPDGMGWNRIKVELIGMWKIVSGSGENGIASRDVCNSQVAY